MTRPTARLQSTIRQGQTTTHGGNPLVLASSIAYEPFGPASSMSLGNGVLASRGHDPGYRPSTISYGGIAHRTLTRDTRGNITATVDALDPSESEWFDYDALSRLTQATGAYGALGFTYEATGDRLTESRDGAVSSYSYASSSHRLLSVSGAAPVSFAYDAAGNATQRGTLGLTYNQANRLAQVSTNGNWTSTNTYDSKGHRALKSTASGSTVFHYDTSGRLIAETSTSGAPLREYVYLDDQPLAMFEAGQVRYFAVDHRGTPFAASDSNGQLLWRARVLPFGTVEPIVSQPSSPIRFPGQYADSETGLYQNWHRDYDPALGRYLQSDPTGLLGGINTYVYVFARPTAFIDETGLGGHGPGIHSPGMVPQDPVGSVEVNGCIGLACITYESDKPESQLDLTFPWDLGASISFCFGPPEPNDCGPPTDRGYDDASFGLGRHLGYTFKKDGGVCVNLGFGLSSPIVVNQGQGPLIK